MCATNHVVRFTRPFPSVFAYFKQSKTGAGEGLGTRLVLLKEHSSRLNSKGDVPRMSNPKMSNPKMSNPKMSNEVLIRSKKALTGLN